VLTSDTDPATPTVNAMRVFSRLDDAYLVVLQGGPHVIFDWGYACVDDLIAAFVGSGTLPELRVTICDGDVISPYVATAPADASDVEEAPPLVVAINVAEQLTNNVEYWLWLFDDTLEFGCDFGGSATYTLNDDGTTGLVLDACEFTDGYAIDGGGAFDADGVLLFDMTTSEGKLTVVYDGVSTTAHGTWNDDPINASNA
jgi:hypothetical protein